jgi:hypothetical protein
MQLYDFPLKRSRGLSRLSISQAFKAQGVTLKYPARGRSGVRWDDGAVVIAIEAAAVEASADGFHCLLWAPRRNAGLLADRCVYDERLEHCRIAARHGGADGLLMGEGGLVDAHTVLPLHVACRDGEYWAWWGSVVRALRVGLVGRDVGRQRRGRLA